MTTREIRAKKGFVDARKIQPGEFYTAEELARTTGKSIQLIRMWSKDGLPVYSENVPHLYFGYDVILFLRMREAELTFGLCAGEFLCYRCRAPGRAVPESIHIVPHRPGVSRATGTCVHGRILSRLIAEGSADDFLKSAREISSPLSRFNDSDSQNGLCRSDDDLYAEKERKQANLARLEALGSPPQRNVENERIRRRFLEHMQEAMGLSDGTLEIYKRALRRYEIFTGFKDFSVITKNKVIALKKHLRNEGLSVPVIISTLYTVRRFMEWLGDEPGYRKTRLRRVLDHMKMSIKEQHQIAPLERITDAPSLDEVALLINSMPAHTFEQRRNRAMIVLFALAAPRATAVVTFRLKHLDLERGLLKQDPREVKTKRSMPIVTVLVPFRRQWLDILGEYFAELVSLGFSPDDPLFPKMAPARGTGAGFNDDEVTQDFFADAQQLRNILNKAFVCAGLRHYTSHAFRHMHGQFTNDSRCDPAIEKAISMNLGHKELAITRSVYANMKLEQRIREIHRLAQMHDPNCKYSAGIETYSDDELQAEIGRRMRR